MIYLNVISTYRQAILSQFSRKAKSTSANQENTDGDEDSADDELDMLEQELEFGDSVGDEDPILDEDQDDIAADVIASDSEAINAVIEDDEHDNIRLEALSAADANLGKLSIAKVCLVGYCYKFPSLIYALSSCEHWPIKS